MVPSFLKGPSVLFYHYHSDMSHGTKNDNLLRHGNENHGRSFLLIFIYFVFIGEKTAAKANFVFAIFSPSLFPESFLRDGGDDSKKPLAPPRFIPKAS